VGRIEEESGGGEPIYEGGASLQASVGGEGERPARPERLEGKAGRRERADVDPEAVKCGRAAREREAGSQADTARQASLSRERTRSHQMLDHKPVLKADTQQAQGERERVDCGTE
jgi:hypothetical protein